MGIEIIFLTITSRNNGTVWGNVFAKYLKHLGHFWNPDNVTVLSTSTCMFTPKCYIMHVFIIFIHIYMPIGLHPEYCFVPVLTQLRGINRLVISNCPTIAWLKKAMLRWDQIHSHYWHTCPPHQRCFRHGDWLGPGPGPGQGWSGTPLLRWIWFKTCCLYLPMEQMLESTISVSPLPPFRQSIFSLVSPGVSSGGSKDGWTVIDPTNVSHVVRLRPWELFLASYRDDVLDVLHTWTGVSSLTQCAHSNCVGERGWQYGN